MQDHDFNRRLGEVVRRERERSRTRSEQIAKALEISVSAYLRYESGDRPIKAAALARIAAVIGSNAGELIEEATRGDRERSRESDVYPLNGDRLRALIDDERGHPAGRLNLVQFRQSVDQAIRLVETLLAGETASAKRILAANLDSQFVHALRFLLSNDERLGREHRDDAVDRLLAIYKDDRGDTPDERSARDQAAYFAAASGIHSVREFLELAYRSERDLWVRRSIVRGLANVRLSPDLADHHEKDLVDNQEMRQVDIGFWRFYSGDEAQLVDALLRPTPRTGYVNTVNALLLNLLASGERQDRRFDFRSLATVLSRAAPRAIRSPQRGLIREALSEKPAEESAVPAWLAAREVAALHHDWMAA